MGKETLALVIAFNYVTVRSSYHGVLFLKTSAESPFIAKYAFEAQSKTLKVKLILIAEDLKTRVIYTVSTLRFPFSARREYLLNLD